MKQTHPITIICLSLIFVCRCREISAGNELLRCVCAVSIYIIIKVSTRHRDIRRSIALLNCNFSSVGSIFDCDVCTITEDNSFKGPAAQRILRIRKTVAVTVIVESITVAVQRPSGHIQRRLHGFGCITAGQLDPDAAVAGRNQTAGDRDTVFKRCAVGELPDGDSTGFDRTAGNRYDSISSGGVIVYRIGCRSRGDIFNMTAFHGQRSAVSNGIRRVASGVVAAAVIDPCVSCAGDQFAGPLCAAVLDRQGAPVRDQGGRARLSGRADHLEAVKIDRHVLAGRDRDRRTHDINCLVGDHGNRGCGTIGRNGSNRISQRSIQRVTDLCDRLIDRICGNTFAFCYCKDFPFFYVYSKFLSVVSHLQSTGLQKILFHYIRKKSHYLLAIIGSSYSIAKVCIENIVYFSDCFSNSIRVLTACSRIRVCDGI